MFLHSCDENFHLFLVLWCFSVRCLWFQAICLALSQWMELLLVRFRECHMMTVQSHNLTSNRLSTQWVNQLLCYIKAFLNCKRDMIVIVNSTKNIWVLSLVLLFRWINTIGTIKTWGFTSAYFFGSKDCLLKESHMFLQDCLFLVPSGFLSKSHEAQILQNYQRKQVVEWYVVIRYDLSWFSCWLPIIIPTSFLSVFLIQNIWCNWLTWSMIVYLKKDHTSVLFSCVFICWISSCTCLSLLLNGCCNFLF
jgi:hypothetical protein